MTKPKRSADEVLAELVEVRYGLKERKDLLKRQNELYVEGWLLGVPKARLAAAGGKALARGEAAVYQVIRKFQQEHPEKVPKRLRP